MIRLATADAPDILCLQEVPAWALRELTIGDIAVRPVVGLVPITARLGRALTDLNHGVLRSAFSGQGNALQLAPQLRVLEHRILTLNPRPFRRTQSDAFGLGPIARLAWGKERRIVQAARLACPDGRTFLVANMHCTSSSDERLPDAELLRAAGFASSFAETDDVVILAGDFNVRATSSPALADLTGPEWGFSPAGDGIDHILVRGAVATALRRWPDARRAHGDRLLSDHAPVELEIETAP